MAKNVSLNEMTYSELASLSGLLTAMGKKPISLGMTIFMAVFYLRRNLTTDAKFREELEKIVLAEELPTPEEWDANWEQIFERINKPKSKS